MKLNFSIGGFHKSVLIIVYIMFHYLSLPFLFVGWWAGAVLGAVFKPLIVPVMLTARVPKDKHKWFWYCMIPFGVCSLCVNELRTLEAVCGNKLFTHKSKCDVRL